MAGSASEAARQLGSIKTERKAVASRENLKAALAANVWTEERKARQAQMMSERMKAAWARRKAAKQGKES